MAGRSGSCAPCPGSRPTRSGSNTASIARAGRHSSATSSAASPPRGCRANKADLVGLSTEAGPVAGSTVYLLKRFYIDSPEGVAGDPGPGERAAGLIEVPRPLAYGLQQMLSGLPRTAIYGLLAAAYALVFGLVGRFNLAFGELAALGAAATAVGVALLLRLGAGGAPAGASVRQLGCAVFAGAIHGAVGGYCAIGADRRPQRPAEPDRHRRAVARADGVSAHRAGHRDRVAAAGLVRAAGRSLRAGDFVVSITPVSLLTTGDRA